MLEQVWNIERIQWNLPAKFPERLARRDKRVFPSVVLVEHNTLTFFWLILDAFVRSPVATGQLLAEFV